MNAAQVVDDYLRAYTSGDADTAASLVSEDFSFRGPVRTTVGREALKGMLSHVASGAQGSRLLRQWQDRDEVCSIYEFRVKTSAGPAEVLITEWNTVRDGKVASSVMVFDTGPFRG